MRVARRTRFGGEVAGLRYHSQISIADSYVHAPEFPIVVAVLGRIGQREIFRAQLLRLADFRNDIVMVIEKLASRFLHKRAKVEVIGKRIVVVAGRGFCVSCTDRYWWRT